MPLIIYFPIIVSLFAIAFIIFLIFKINKAPAIKDKALAGTRTDKEGALFYVKRQYQMVAIVAPVVFFVILFALGWSLAIGFLLGIIFSGLLAFGYVLLFFEGRAKALKTFKKEAGQSFDLAYTFSLVAGLLVASLALFAISSYYFLTDANGLLGLIFGASMVSLFIGIDRQIRIRILPVSVNQLADGLSGMLAESFDIFESMLIAMASAMLLGSFLYPKSFQFVLLILFLVSISLLSCVVGSFFVHFGKNKNSTKALYKSAIMSLILSAIVFYPAITNIMADQIILTTHIYLSCLMGLAMAAGILFIGLHYGAKQYHHLLFFVNLAVLILVGFGMSFWLAGLYGAALATVSLLSVGSIFVGLNACALIGAPPVTKTIYKLYAKICAILAALMLLLVYRQKIITITGNQNITNNIIFDPKLIAGLLLGVILFYLWVLLFSRFTKKIVSKPEILAKIFKWEMALLVVIMLVAPIIIGLALGAVGLGGLLMGATITGLWLSFIHFDKMPKWTGLRNAEPIGPALHLIIKMLGIVAVLVAIFLV